MSTETLYRLMPEMTLVAAATLIYLGGVFVTARGAWSTIAVVGIVAAGGMLFGQYEQLFQLDMTAIGQALQPALDVPVANPLAVDLFSQYVRWLALVVGFALVLMSSQLARDVQVPEYVGSVLLAVVGLMLVAAARELVLLFVGLELISIPTYVLLYLGRRNVDSQEATAKYFFLSILSSAVMLYGFSFLYGAAGSTELVAIRDALAGLDENAGMAWFARLALVLIFAGLSFKVTAVPFHFYAPDVYQGTTAGNAALLSVVPKVAGLVALVRIVVASMPGFATYAWQIALVLALLTMTLGNLVALWQDNVRRLLAYSSIAHGGYMLIGLAVACVGGERIHVAAGFDGIAALLFYAAAYALATTGCFAVLVYLGGREGSIDKVDQLAGVGRTHPWAGLSMAVCLFSLTGIPPLAGFWGKLNLLAGALSLRPRDEEVVAVRMWFVALAAIAVVNAAIAASYYLRLVGIMYFREAEGEPRRPGTAGAGMAMILCAALVVMAGVMPGMLERGANAAGESVRMPSTVPAVDTAQPSDEADDRFRWEVGKRAERARPMRIQAKPPPPNADSARLVGSGTAGAWR